MDIFFFFLDGVFVGLVSDILLVDTERVPLSDSKSCNTPPPTPLKLKSHRGQDPLQTGGHNPSDQPLRFLQYVLLFRYAGRGRVLDYREGGVHEGDGKRERGQV